MKSQDVISVQLVWICLYGALFEGKELCDSLSGHVPLKQKPPIWTNTNLSVIVTLIRQMNLVIDRDLRTFGEIPDCL